MKPCNHRCTHSRRNGMLQFEVRKVKSALSSDWQHCRNLPANLTQQLFMTGKNHSLCTGRPHQIAQSALLRTLRAFWLMYEVQFQLRRYPPGEFDRLHSLPSLRGRHRMVDPQYWVKKPSNLSATYSYTTTRSMHIHGCISYSEVIGIANIRSNSLSAYSYGYRLC